MKTVKSIFSLILLLIAFGTTAQTKEQQEIMRDAQMAQEAFIANDPNMADLFRNATGYVIFPNVGKGAYIVGGAAGNGVVYQNGKAIGMAKLRQLDIGLQIGGQAFRQAILFQTQAELDRFKAGNFELSSTVSAVAIEKGVAKSIEFRDGIAVVTMPKAGAMIEVSVGGQKFEYESF
ncbi:MAG: lipid-binding SYLF domain-containing protein [Gillisia sp.]